MKPTIQRRPERVNKDRGHRLVPGGRINQAGGDHQGQGIPEVILHRSGPFAQLARPGFRHFRLVGFVVLLLRILFLAHGAATSVVDGEDVQQPGDQGVDRSELEIAI